MLLIDACYVNSEGGKSLLFYLIRSLNKKDIPFVVLFDERSQNKLPENTVSTISFYIKSSLRQRYLYYKKILKKYPIKKIFCFGNIPPTYRVKNVIIYTFLQNVLMIEGQGSLVPFKKRMQFKLKSIYLSIFKSNTDFWIVQTEDVKSLLIKHLNINIETVLVIPFFENLNIDSIIAEKQPNTFFYPSTGEPHKNHLNLLKAWEILFGDGYNFELYLTLPISHIELCNEITNLKNKGLKIYNLGLLNKTDLALRYARSEYIIFPSFFESFGMGIIEAVEFNCKVIAPDLPYVHAIVIPSYKFNPSDSKSIATSVLNSVSTNKSNALLKIKDEMDRLISIIC